MNKTTTTSVAFAVLGFFLVSCLTSCNSRPKEFKSEAGAFSVATPAVLKEEVRSSNFPQVGAVAIHIFSGDQADAGYMVSYADLPEELVSKADPEKMLDGSRDGEVSNVNGKLALETRISLDNNPGREIVVDLKAPDGRDATLKSRIYLVKNRLYQVMIIAHKGDLSVDEMTRYLGSFKLI